MPSSNAYEIGDPVYAIGSPNGIPNTFTQGMISGVDIQRGIIHDAVTYHGSSGGPLLNSQGQVIGVNYGGTEFGLNLAVPLDKVKTFINPLIETQMCTPQFNPGLLDP